MHRKADSQGFLGDLAALIAPTTRLDHLTGTPLKRQTAHLDTGKGKLRSQCTQNPRKSGLARCVTRLEPEEKRTRKVCYEAGSLENLENSWDSRVLSPRKPRKQLGFQGSEALRPRSTAAS